MESCFSKNPISRSHSKINEIFIGRKKPLKIYVARVHKLLNDGYKEIIVHGSGMAIPVAILLANQVKLLFAQHIIHTSSVQVVDEIHERMKIRLIPAVHILFIL